MRWSPALSVVAEPAAGRSVCCLQCGCTYLQPGRGAASVECPLCGYVGWRLCDARDAEPARAARHARARVT